MPWTRRREGWTDLPLPPAFPNAACKAPSSGVDIHWFFSS